jgi:hypothetical protein
MFRTIERLAGSLRPLEPPEAYKNPLEPPEAYKKVTRRLPGCGERGHLG